MRYTKAVVARVGLCIRLRGLGFDDAQCQHVAELGIGRTVGRHRGYKLGLGTQSFVEGAKAGERWIGMAFDL